MIFSSDIYLISAKGNIEPTYEFGVEIFYRHRLKLYSIEPDSDKNTIKVGKYINLTPNKRITCVKITYKIAFIICADYDKSIYRKLWPLLLTWFNFNPSMDK